MKNRVSFCGLVCACFCLSLMLLAGSALAKPNCPGERDEGMAQDEYYAQALRYMGKVDRDNCQAKPKFNKDTLYWWPAKLDSEVCEVVKEALDRVRALDEIASTGPLPSDFDEFMEDIEFKIDEALRKAKTRDISKRYEVLSELNAVACGDEEDSVLPEPRANDSNVYVDRYQAQERCLPKVVAQIMQDARTECDEISGFMPELALQIEELNRSIEAKNHDNPAPLIRERLR